ncbi:MAG: DUF1566 domain-containing protein [Bacteroidales bacterium]|jgi:hypothetical protein|nr:DUF1566 domain-containing protein [Bacteroidales bacterium]
MKKVFLCVTTLFFCGFLQAQNVEVHINSSQANASSSDCGYKIAGVCSSEDVGGVETNISSYQINFKNYNDFAVNVVYEINGDKIGSLVLKANENKNVAVSYSQSGKPSVKLIVRKNASVSDDKITLMGYLYVFPEDLGHFYAYPAAAVNAINKRGTYGINTWRLPTHDELKILDQNAQKINLGHYWDYASQYDLEKGKFELDPWRKGKKVRLVATEE